MSYLEDILIAFWDKTKWWLLGILLTAIAGFVALGYLISLFQG